MQMREREGVRAIVDIDAMSAEHCRVSMIVEHRGRRLWSSTREMTLAESDRGAVERTALEAVSAIADHLVRRHRVPRP